MDSTQPEIIHDHRDGVLRVTFARAGRANALDGPTMDAACGLLREADEDPSIRVVVLSAQGEHFCAGLDLDWLSTAQSQAQVRAQVQTTLRFFDTLASLSMPLVAVLHGAVFGGGVGIAAAADLVIATEDTYFAISEVRLGMAPLAMLELIKRKIHPSRLHHWALSGARFGVTEALAGGLVHRVVADRASLETAVAVELDALRRAAPQAQRFAKRLLREPPLSADVREALLVAVRSCEEVREGTLAFTERRTPSWAGSEPLRGHRGA